VICQIVHQAHLKEVGLTQNWETMTLQIVIITKGFTYIAFG
jgi:hypothetical protein